MSSERGKPTIESAMKAIDDLREFNQAYYETMGNVAAACDIPARLLVDPHWKARLDQQLRHEMPPPSWDDMRTLYLLAFGQEAPKTRKRCKRCGGSGMPLEHSDGTGGERARQTVTCLACNGSGFESI